MKILQNKFIAMIVVTTTVFLLGAAAVFAYGGLNDDPQDCLNVGIGNVDTGEGIDPVCWDNAISASPGDDINVILYFHNSGNTPINNVTLRLDRPSESQDLRSYTFRGSVSGGGDVESGTARVSLNSSSNLVFDKLTIETQSRSRRILSDGENIFSSSGLNIGTVYPGWEHQGVVKAVFRVDGDHNDDDDYDYNDLRVVTDRATSIDDDRATLNGEYEDADNADIFFVWSRDESDVEDVDRENEISDIDDVEIEIVERNADGDDSSVRETIRGLREDTRYYFRLCAEQDRDLECGNVRNFRTDDNGRDRDEEPTVGTCSVSSVGTTFATLRADFYSDTDAEAYFNYGRTQSMTSRTSTQDFDDGDRVVTRSISGLSPSTTYYCELVVENDEGEETGNRGSFRTQSILNRVIVPDPVVVRQPATVIPARGDGALVILEIDDNQETATRGETLQYEVTWNNVSGRDLDEVALFIQLPRAARFIATTDGTYNRRDHAVYVPLGDLEAGDEDEMTITVRVGSAREGEPIVAEAVLAFENPEEGGNAFLNAVELDADTYTLGGIGLGAGLFGLGLPTTLVGWLLFLLVLALILLAVRYFYLNERDRRYYRRNNDVGPYNPRS